MTQRNPSKITTELAVDEPLVQNAGFSFDKNDRQYLDNQIRGVQQHLVEALIRGRHATYAKIASTSAALAAGDVVCLASVHEGEPKVTEATPEALALALTTFGVMAYASAPDSYGLVVLGGLLPPEITGLAPNNPGFVRVNAGRCERVDAYTVGDYGVGTVDHAGWLHVIPGHGASATASAVGSAENVGEGAEVFKTLLGAILQFRRILGVGGITATVDGDTVRIDGSGVTGGAGNPAGDVGDMQLHGAGGVFEGLGGAAGHIARRNELGTAWVAEEPLELPTDGANGYVLTRGTTPEDLSWTAKGEGGDGTPGGDNGDIQFNDDGEFGGHARVPVNKGGTDKNLASLEGQALKAVIVNAEEDGYAFAAIPEGAAVPTGTGFRRVVDGVEQSAAAAVDLAGGSSHVTGVLPSDHGGTGKNNANLAGNVGKALVVNSGANGYDLVELPEGSSTPTGTGFRHVIDGSEQAAAKLVEDADVHTSAGIGITKLATADADGKVFVRFGSGNSFQFLINANIASNANIDATKLAPSATPSRLLMTTSGGAVAWGQLPLDTNWTTGTLPISRGGTGLSTVGANGTVATSNGSAIVWATIVNANVATNAAIAGTKITPDFGSQNVFTTGFMQAAYIRQAGTVASEGFVRLAAGPGGIVTVESGGNAKHALAASAGGELFVGTDTGYTSAKQWSNVRMYAASGLYFGISSSTRMYIAGGEFAANPSGSGNQIYAQSGQAFIATANGQNVFQADSAGVKAVAGLAAVFLGTSRGLSLFSSSEQIPSGGQRGVYIPNSGLPEAGSMPTPSNGVIVFAHGGDLYVKRPDGSTGRVNLTIV